MDKIKCEVIRDLMPLVADEVASAESKELVDGHMEGCEVCKAYYAGMTAQLARMAVPEDKSAFVNFSHRMERRVRMKKVFIALTAAIVALCVVVVGGMVVFDRMHTYYPMPTEQTKAWLWQESNGEVNLMVQMQDGHGWYNSLGMSREGDVFYLTPHEPDLKLWNKGVTGGLYDEYQIDLLWENDQLYYYITFGNAVYNADADFFETEEKEYKIPLRFVRWGTATDYTTIYEEGDMIPTRKELLEQLEAAKIIPAESKAPGATATPAATATPVPSVKAGD